MKANFTFFECLFPSKNNKIFQARWSCFVCLSLRKADDVQSKFILIHQRLTVAVLLRVNFMPENVFLKCSWRLVKMHFDMFEEILQDTDERTQYHCWLNLGLLI